MSLLITDGPKDEFGLLGMQTDETLFVGTPAFVNKEEKEIQNVTFLTNPITILSPKNQLEFNGCTITMVGKMDGSGCLELTQKGRGTKLVLIDLADPEQAQKYVEQPARRAYIASICQPEASFDLTVAAQAQKPDEEDIKRLNEQLEWQINN